ncbi:MAG: GntR family transcriptional regulator [Nodosilinea sp. LVE1205-7]
MAKLEFDNFKSGPRTTHASVTESLRQAILLGQLPGGTRLVQSELAEAFRVSVTPIREALRELSSQGLIELDAFKGATVRRPTLEELEEIYQLRSTLIPLSVQQGMNRITAEDLRQAEAILAQMETSSNPEAWVDLNRQFHTLLDKTAANRLLRQCLIHLSDLSAVYINLSLKEQPLRRDISQQEHRDILQAYINRDAKTATQLILNHLTSTLETDRAALIKQNL